MRLPLIAAPVVAALFLTSTASSSCSRNPAVRLSNGAYEGTKLRNGVDQFIGMRYAAPPLGDLRWRAPRQPAKHSGIEQAYSVSLHGRRKKSLEISIDNLQSLVIIALEQQSSLRRAYQRTAYLSTCGDRATAHHRLSSLCGCLFKVAV